MASSSENFHVEKEDTVVDYFDDDLDEVIVTFIPEELVKIIGNGKDSNLDLINADPAHSDFTQRKIKTIDLKLSKDEICAKTFTIFETVLSSMKADGCYFVAAEETVEARKKAITLVELDCKSNAAVVAAANASSNDNNNDNLNPYVSIISGLYEIALKCESHCLLTEAKKAMWQDFYLHLSSKRSGGWLYLMDIVSKEISGSEFDLFVFKLAYIVMERLFVLNLEAYENENSAEIRLASSKLDDRESNILKYVAGFVAFSLKKRFNRHPNELNQNLLKSLESWTVKEYEKSCFEFKNKWVSLVNRGGLVDVNDKCFLFFRSIEYAVRRVFNVELLQKYAGENLKELLIKQIFNNKHVIYCWDRLTESTKLSKDEKERLFKDVVSYWISIRGRAFVRAWVDGLRMNYRDKVSSKGEHSHRKQLNAKSKK